MKEIDAVFENVKLKIKLYQFLQISPDIVQSTKTVSTRGHLRSANKSGYVLPRLLTKFAQRGFAYAGPAAWNRLPESLRSIPSQAAFKRQLKTFLFCDAFNIVYDEPWLFYIALYVCNASMVFYYVMGALANF